jgi:hypothetical protein
MTNLKELSLSESQSAAAGISVFMPSFTRILPVLFAWSVALGIAWATTSSENWILPTPKTQHPAPFDAGETLAYDDGMVRTWWSSDRDSFGVAVRFTPRQYPCDVLGALAVIHYDDGTSIYLRVYDDNGSGGLPGAVLYNEHRTDITHDRDSSYKSFDLTSPVTVTSGDFYLCFFQKNVWDMIFASDARLDSASREWWYFPDLGWRTPFGMDAADHLIRAKVQYSTGVTEEIGSPSPTRPPQLVEFSLNPNPITHGTALLSYTLPDPGPFRACVYNLAGEPVEELAIPTHPPPAPNALILDLRRLVPGVYLMQLETPGFRRTLRFVKVN